MRLHNLIIVLWFVTLVAAHARGTETAADPIQVDKTGSVSGTLRARGGKPVAGVRLQLHEDRQPRKLVAEAVTDDAGRFQFKNIEAGKYHMKGGSQQFGFVYIEVLVQAGKNTDMGVIELQ